MKFVLVTVLSLVACAFAFPTVETGYHNEVGIPMAKKIKAAEDAILAKRNSGARIVGGQQAEPNAHPYLAGILATLESGDTSVCGGTLVSTTRVLTSARCKDDGTNVAIRLAIILGSDMLFTGGHRTVADQVISHPDWDPSTLQNDIALLVLNVALTLTDAIQPITLPTDLLDETFDGEASVAVGYGVTSNDQTSVSVFAVVNQVDLQVISNDDCQTVWGSWLQSTNICTNGTGGVGICRGDLGGPLFVTRDDEPVLVGIGSFVSASGCDSGSPSVFTRVTSFNDFLQEYL